MTWLGIIFWGTCALAILIAIFMQRNWGTKSLEKENKQVLHEEITRKSHSNDQPRSKRTSISSILKTT